MPPSARNTGNAGAYAVGVCILVADFEFGTEPAEVIADDAVDVEALLVFDRHRVRCFAKVEIGVLDDHTAAIDTAIPGAVTALGCGGECSRSEGHSNGTLLQSYTLYKTTSIQNYKYRQTKHS